MCALAVQHTREGILTAAAAVLMVRSGTRYQGLAEYI